MTFATRLPAGNIKGSDVVRRLQMILLEQKGKTCCLTPCRTEKQPRTALWNLFGVETSE